MFTKNNTFTQIMSTTPIQTAIGNLFPTCWSARIQPEHATHTMSQIETETTMEWGVPFISDAFIECANLLMDTVKNNRFLFVPLWNTKPKNWIPDADVNNADGVWLFTGNPDTDITAFAHPKENGSTPPYASNAVPFETRENRTKRPAAIICPGGGYEMVSTYSEGVQLAQRLERDGGYKAFILNYRITPNYYPLPQMDLALAIMHVRAHAAHYRIDPDRIIVIGASAGGHLCASEACLHTVLKEKVLAELANHPNGQGAVQSFKGISARPDAMGLLYPVISFTSQQHEGSYLALTGDQPKLRGLLSVETQVTKDFPPAYAFANEDDDCVPPSNTTRLDDALRSADIPHLCQLFPSGGHGIGLGYGSSCETWSEHMLQFFEQL